MLLGAACLPFRAPAQTLIVRNYSVQDGLANPQVYAIAEDREGFLWIGTWEGINRFDGTVLTRYDEGDGVPPGRIFGFQQTPDGALYVGGDGGVAVFDGRRFLPAPAESGLAGAPIRAVAGLPDGTAVFGGERGIVARRPDGRWRTLSGASVTALLGARDGTLYAGTAGHGVFRLRDGKILPVPRVDGGPGEPWGGGEVSALAEGSGGALYAGTSRGLAVLRGGELRSVPAAGGEWIQAIALGEDGVLYLATKKSGVLRLRAATLEPLPPVTQERGLAGERVNALHAVPGGPVFFGTSAGLDLFGGEALQTWTRGQGLPDGTVFSLAEDARGDLYAALSKGGAALLRDGRWRTLGPAEGLPPGKTLSVHLGASGLLYAGDDQGRVWISRRGRLLRRVDLPGVRGVVAILEAPGGEVYAATLEGLAVIGRRGARVVRDGLPGAQVYALAPAADGTLYLATNGGLAAFRGGAVVRVWTRADGLPDDWIFSVRTGRDGAVYAGTRRGLAVLRKGRVERTYTRAEGLTNNVINCVLEDGEGRLYLSTNRGVDVLDPRAPAGSRAVSIPGTDRHTGNTGACLRDRRGRLWFGLDSDLALYDPTHQPVRRPPRALLTGLQVFKKAQPLRAGGASKPFPHDRNDLTFSFTGIDLAAHLLRFRYRLAGLDADWIDTDQRSARYPNLQPGSYRFDLQAVNDAGLWSPPERLPFTIEPPWWRRPAQLLALVLLAALLTGGLYAAARMQRLLAMERLRATIAADLHDQVGAGLTDIAILSEVAARKAGGSPGSRASRPPPASSSTRSATSCGW